MTPQQYCEQKTAQSGSSFYYSFMFLAKPQREAITALYAFCREVDDIADDCTYNSRKNYTLNHLIERIKIYNEENFNYEILTINLKNK